MDFYLWLEKFDTVSDFLLNPNHKHKTFYDLIHEFEASGGKFLGSGRQGRVFDHPKWKYVVKMFDDPIYLGFARFAYTHPHPAFPKIYGPPQKIVPFFTRTKNFPTTYIARIEKLKPLTDMTLIKTIVQDWQAGLFYIQDLKKGIGDAEFEKEVISNFKDRKNEIEPYKIKVKHHQHAIDLIQKYPQLKNLFEGIYVLHQAKLPGSFDITGSNIMQRDNGDLVLADPLWGGETPYETERRLNQSEIGYEGWDEPEDLVGGELPKKKRKKKKKNYPMFGSKEIPF